MSTHPSLIHNLNSKKISDLLSLPVVLGIIVAAVIVGVGTGYAAASFTSGGTTTTTKTDSQTSGTSETFAGVKDEKAFPDKTEGKLAEGGFEGEGSFHLVRPGGVSQNVYLTSTAVDLSKFVGKKVKVWGKTYDSEKAGWLMDAGYVEVVK